MEITESKKGNFFILALKGRLDANSIDQFEKKLVEKIDEGYKNIAIDFAGVEYISSSGLRVFVIGAKKLDQYGKKLNLCNIQEHIQEVFNITGFTPIFNFYDDVKSVVEK
ncbi:MAG: STAS domain-containing protein [Ignavibacteria bacterium]|jgi:anti-sigma B factor antagonist